MKTKIAVLFMTTIFIALSLWCIFGSKSDYSDSERRLLAKEPDLSWEAISSGEFASDFESYAVDHFPARDTFRSLKAYTRLYLFMQKDNNGLFQKEGHLSKLEYPGNPQMREHTSQLFAKIHEKYLTDNTVYFAMIPDKNCYLADLTLNYDEFEKDMASSLPFATPISISDLLSAEDYYYTDTHWRQEQITDVADLLAKSMGTSLPKEYETKTLSTPFYGVYVGQSALSVSPDEIRYLTNPTMENFVVEGATLYDMKKLEGKDLYEMFLSGNQPLITIQNPANASGKRLILFRDSFGSSIAPLLAQGYSETVLIDLRYVSSDMLGQFVKFENADVLFLYSTLLLNNSLSMK